MNHNSMSMKVEKIENRNKITFNKREDETFIIFGNKWKKHKKIKCIQFFVKFTKNSITDEKKRTFNFHSSSTKIPQTIHGIRKMEGNYCLDQCIDRRNSRLYEFLSNQANVFVGRTCIEHTQTHFECI